MDRPERILAVLDGRCDSFVFPMLDNGYVYLAATRLSLFRSQRDWAMAIEIFGFSPRAGMPDVAVLTFASTLHDRNQPSRYVDEEGYRRYVRTHPHDEHRTFFPIEEGPWIEEEMVSRGNGVQLTLRDRTVTVPPRTAYAKHGIELHAGDGVHVFELCRYLAAIERDRILATPAERRVSILPGMEQLLQLEEWHHPDTCKDERPSELESFQQLARVLSTGNVHEYRPTSKPNTHWSNWPDGGTL